MFVRNGPSEVDEDQGAKQDWPETFADFVPGSILGNRTAEKYQTQRAGRLRFTKHS
jgi:hypothetical protein